MSYRHNFLLFLVGYICTENLIGKLLQWFSAKEFVSGFCLLSLFTQPAGLSKMIKFFSFHLLRFCQDQYTVCA